MAVQSGLYYEVFDLDMGDWTDEPEETSVQPPSTKKWLHLSLGKEARPLRDTTNLRYAERAREYWGARERSQSGCSNEHHTSLLNVLSRILRAGHVAGPPLLPMQFRVTC